MRTVTDRLLGPHADEEIRIVLGDDHEVEQLLEFASAFGPTGEELVRARFFSLVAQGLIA
ncbi:MAG: hypothetical protein WCJ42_08680 [Actinomycetes bacterium]